MVDGLQTLATKKPSQAGLDWEHDSLTERHMILPYIFHHEMNEDHIKKENPL